MKSLPPFTFSCAFLGTPSPFRASVLFEWPVGHYVFELLDNARGVERTLEVRGAGHQGMGLATYSAFRVGYSITFKAFGI